MQHKHYHYHSFNAGIPPWPARTFVVRLFIIHFFDPGKLNFMKRVIKSFHLQKSQYFISMKCWFFFLKVRDFHYNYNS